MKREVDGGAGGAAAGGGVNGAVNGVLPLNKPDGVTSAKIAARACKLLGAKKAGHGGTLDPAASGLLLVMCGEATKFAQYLLGADKTYAAKIVFGKCSSTDDREGEITAGPAPPPRPADLAAAINELLPQFTGDILQRPPKHSAIKHKGRRLYDYARKGEDAPNLPRPARVYSINLESVHGVEAELTIRCAGGVYIRSIARDMGEMLGCGAYLSALQRAAIGHYQISQSVTPDGLENTPPEKRAEILLSVDSIVHNLPAATLADGDIANLGAGKELQNGGKNGNGSYRIYSPAGKFAGIAENVNGALRPKKFLHWTREQC